MSKGWSTSGTSANFKVHFNSGDRTYSGDEICPSVSYDKSFCTIENGSYGYKLSLYGLEKLHTNPDEDVKVSRMYEGHTCSDDCLTMWFRETATGVDANKDFTNILPSTDSLDGFREHMVSKNIDECNQLFVRESTDTTMLFGKVLLSEASSYVDGGYPAIADDPYDWYSSNSVSGKNYKYINNEMYVGHKVKYLIGSGNGTTGMTIPQGYFSISNQSPVQNLVEVYFPHRRNDGCYVSAIGNQAFEGNTSISAVTFGGVENVGDKAFNGCSSLKLIDLGHATCKASESMVMKEIGASAFTSTAAEKLYVFANTGNASTKTVIKERAFSDNPNLTTFTLELTESGVDLNDNILLNTPKLEDVTIKSRSSGYELKASQNTFANIMSTASTLTLTLDNTNSGIALTANANHCFDRFSQKKVVLKGTDVISGLQHGFSTGNTLTFTLEGGATENAYRSEYPSYGNWTFVEPT